MLTRARYHLPVNVTTKIITCDDSGQQIEIQRYKMQMGLIHTTAGQAALAQTPMLERKHFASEYRHWIDYFSDKFIETVALRVRQLTQIG